MFRFLTLLLSSKNSKHKQECNEKESISRWDYPGGIPDDCFCRQKAQCHPGRDFVTKDKEITRKRNVIRNYRDSVFRMLFKEKKELLSMFNAINGTDYSNPDELDINTLENAIYMAMKNDVSCVLNLQMNLYEHQSTVNPNMPLRYLMYVGTLYEKMVVHQDIYARKQILLPAPKFIVLYQGDEPQPERKTFRLSDTFMTDTGEINLELAVLQLNINRGMNCELKENCKPLSEYTQYVERVRGYLHKMSPEEAVERAVTECINENILRDFLIKNRAEVTKMSIFEYDEELHRRSLLEEGMELGREQGIELGIERGVTKTALKMLEDGKLSMEEIAGYSGLALEKVKELSKELQMV